MHRNKQNIADTLKVLHDNVSVGKGYNIEVTKGKVGAGLKQKCF